MKKVLFMMILALVTLAINTTKAQTSDNPKDHGFINPKLHGMLNLEQGKAALLQLMDYHFETDDAMKAEIGQTVVPSTKYKLVDIFNPRYNLDFLANIYCQKMADIYHAENKGDFIRIIEKTSGVPFSAREAGQVKFVSLDNKGGQKTFSRNPYPGEMLGEYDEISWISFDCLNPTGEQAPPDTYVYQAPPQQNQGAPPPKKFFSFNPGTNNNYNNNSLSNYSPNVTNVTVNVPNGSGGVSAAPATTVVEKERSGNGALWGVLGAAGGYFLAKSLNNNGNYYSSYDGGSYGGRTYTPRTGGGGGAPVHQGNGDGGGHYIPRTGHPVHQHN